MSNYINREIEELKKKLEELEKASQNMSEEVLKEEPKKDFPREKKETENSQKGLYIALALALLVLASIVVYAALQGGINNGGVSQKDFSNLSDIDRGFTITNGLRAWFDQDKYLKNQERPDRCFNQIRKGNKIYFCDATEKEVAEARNSGREIEIDSNIPIILKIFQIDSEHPIEPKPDESQFVTMSDSERGFTISTTGYRIWRDFEKYEKNQINKEYDCIPWKWDWNVGIMCYATKEEVKEAKESGREEFVFVNAYEIFQRYGKSPSNKTPVSAETRHQRHKITSQILK